MSSPVPRSLSDMLARRPVGISARSAYRLWYARTRVSARTTVMPHIAIVRPSRHGLGLYT